MTGCAPLMSSVGEPICVPPGVPPIALWTPGPAEVSAIADEDGRSIVTVRRYYRLDTTMIYGAWVEGRLAVVDTNVRDETAPVWVDLGVISPKMILRRDRRQSCAWQRANAMGA
jgi:hypothetical protein